MHRTPPNDKFARKYCFCASVRITNSRRVPVGMFVAYDIKPSIAKELESIGQEFCMTCADDQYICDDVHLVIHKECPVELTGEVMFQTFEAFNEDDDDVRS